MKTFEITATEENLIQALQDDVLNRNKDIVHFYNLLMAQESATTIAIDGRWGSGKTFFVKQTMMVINAKNPICNIDNEKKVKITYKLPFPRGSEDENYDLAVYYDAWENDNDTDPILSLVYEITKQLSMDYDFKDTDLFKAAASIVELISGKNWTGLLESLKGENPVEKFKEQKKLSEEIKHFFEEVLVERGNRLVVFIDELDRCKPTYAVRLLEQIKHYFCDDNVVFVFSVNIDELQHTIKHYYGDEFDACRYLDRFFDIRVALPPADKSRFYSSIGLNSSYGVDVVSRRVIDMMHFELREISRFYRQVKTSVYVPTHDNNKYDFGFADGKARQFMMICIVPLAIGLRIVEISRYDDFVNGNDESPLIELFDAEEFAEWLLPHFLGNNESFENEPEKKKVTRDEIIRKIYNAIFVNKYEGRKYCEQIGEYQFDVKSREFVINASSMLSDYANFEL